MTTTVPERLETVRHPKQQADVPALLDEVQHSPFIGEITPGEIAQRIQANSVLFFYDGVTLAGLAAWDEINATWVELGPFYTVQAYRGQGLGSVMFDTVEHMHREAGRKLYAITKNPVVKRMFLRRGFREVRLWQLPLAILCYLVTKISLRKLLRHARKLRFGESVSHFVKTVGD